MPEPKFDNRKDLQDFMDEFPANSNKAKEPKEPKPKKEKEKKIEKVITGDVVERKRPFGSKIKDVFIGGEFKSAMMYIAAEVLLPAARNMIVDATTKGIERVVYGDDPRRRPSGSRNRVNYSHPMDRFSPISRNVGFLPEQQARVTRRHDVNDLVLATREEAEIVVERLGDIIDRYESASVADLKDLVGLPTSFVDNGWGWVSVNNITIRQTRDGFVLNLPNVEVVQQ